MAYDALITMVSKFYTRESLRKSYEDEATLLENFIKNVKEINSSNTELNEVRLNTQVKGLTGASRPNFKEFIKLANYFEPSSMIRDYRVFSLYRSCFNLEYSSDLSRVIKVNLNDVNEKKRIRQDWLAIFVVIVMILFFLFLIKPVLTNWFLNDWHINKTVVGIILNGSIFFFVTVILRINFDRENFKELKKKIEKLNSNSSNT